MKRFYLVLLFTFYGSFLSTPCGAQSMEDVVYFKNGSVLRGQILEQWPGVSLKIQTQDGAIHVYSMQDVAKVAKFETPPDNTNDASAPSVPPETQAPVAQAPARMPSRTGRTGFGLLVGGTLATLDVPDIYGGNSGVGELLGFSAGCFVDFGISDVFSIQPGFYYAMKGDNFPGDGVSLHLDYLEVPLLMQVGFPIGGDLRLDLFTGPSLSILTSASYSYQGTSYPETGYFNTLDAGWVLGGGLEIGRFLVNLRYEDGLTSVDTGANGTNSVFSLMAGIRVN